MRLGPIEPSVNVVVSPGDRLFIADRMTDGRLWAVNISSDLTTPSSSTMFADTGDHKPWSLSLFANSRLTLTSQGDRTLFVYDTTTSTNGTVLQNVELPDYIDPQHALETDRRTFIVCHRLAQRRQAAGGGNVRITEVDGSGGVMREYADVRNLLHWPVHMASSSKTKSLIVADRSTRRLVVFDSQLNFRRVLLDGLALPPWRMSANEAADQFAVGFYEKSAVVLYDYAF